MNILVGYDASNESKKALELAIKHAKAFKAMIHVLHSRVTSLPEKDFQKTEHEMNNIKKDITAKGISCEVHLLIRNVTPGEHIVEFARENDIDEIFIGIIPASKIKKDILGSAVGYVIDHAHCPVIITK